MQHQEVCTNLFPASKLNSMAPRHTFPACRLSVQSGRLSVQTAGRSGVNSILTVTLHSVGLAFRTITKNIGQITDRCNFDARGTGFSAVAVTELLCSQVCYIQLVMFLSGFILIVF
jgi:hypothetical protein